MIRRTRLCLLAMAALIASVVVYYGVFFQGALPDHRWIVGYNDLILHAAAFLALSIPLLLLWPARGVIPGLFGLACMLEVIQIWLPGRNPGWDDVAAGMAGVLIGASFVGASRQIRIVLRPEDG